MSRNPVANAIEHSDNLLPHNRTRIAAQHGCELASQRSRVFRRRHDAVRRLISFMRVDQCEFRGNPARDSD
jgi:hypothetical protein